MSQSHRLVFFGNERLVSGLKTTSAPLLRGLIEHGYNVAAVVAHHETTRSRSARTLEVAAIAAAHNIPLLTPKKPLDIIDELRDYNADAAVLSAYGRLIPARIIDLFEPYGIINLHPSLLPRHRGPTPIETTILHGDKVAGVSIMKLAPGMDDGPLYGQITLPLSGHETKFDLYDKLSKRGSELLLELLPSILSGHLKPKSQKNNDVSVTSLISKSDGILCPETDTATVLERKIRAYLGYPKCRISLNNHDVIITSAKVVQTLSKDHLTLTCQGQTYLEVTELIAPSGKVMSGEAFLRGYAA